MNRAKIMEKIRQMRFAETIDLPLRRVGPRVAEHPDTRPRKRDDDVEAADRVFGMVAFAKGTMSLMRFLL
ncbi:MAG: hypothetical protein LBL72_06425 [Candidatus Accumulibacter sp.]|nr:hypothetical protein [Accumulibacter sp.]